MTSRVSIPSEILAQHIAVLGKTGSGKTSTAKLLTEQVVAEGARVCILDPIKSDWWGLTSSADGKRAGLPFHILGGPRGHVPLHASAGKAIGEIVASGALPLSIIDMADFEPGGQAKFFVDFAPTLLRKMRGVVYLVIEEAHLFAPKERSGIGAENLSIHWAKTLATAGRSKGIRLVLVTQRTQALHNALLGSCDTMIAHRLTAPADQEPVVKWLKANTSKEVLEKVSSTLASLKTGDAWLCSGEAKRFEIVHFPRIATYDNTATPTGDGDAREIKTAAVDQEKLRAIIGDAVEKAKADDPRELKKRIHELELQVAGKAMTAVSMHLKEKRVEVLTDADRALLKALADRFGGMAAELGSASGEFIAGFEQHIEKAIQGVLLKMHERAEHVHETRRREFERMLDAKGLQEILGKLASVQPPALYNPQSANAATAERPNSHGRRAVPGVTATRPTSVVPPSNGNGELGRVHRAFLTVLANRLGKPTRRNQMAVFSGYSAKSRHVDNTISALRTSGYLHGSSDALAITQAGLDALGTWDELPSGRALIDYWIREAGTAPGAMLRALVDVYPKTLTRDQVAEASNYSPTSRHVDNSLSYLRTLELIAGDRLALQASDELFL